MTLAERQFESTHDHCTHEDVEASVGFVERMYHESGATPETQKENLIHSAVVREYAIAIAKAEGLDPHFMGVAGQGHDSKKLDKALPGQINTWEHHHLSGAAMGKFFKEERKKNEELSKRMDRVIRCHSHIPFIRTKFINDFYDTERVSKEQRNDPAVTEPLAEKLQQFLDRRLPEPKTPEELALRDADMLAMIDVEAGLRKLVKIRQNPDSFFYNQDEGKLGNAIASAMMSARQAHDILHFPSSKKNGARLYQRLVEFQTAFAQTQGLTLESFLQFCKDWVAKENEETFV